MWVDNSVNNPSGWFPICIIAFGIIMYYVWRGIVRHQTWKDENDNWRDKLEKK